jgi:hypothetical protein
MKMHLVDPQHFVRASSTVSRRLAKAFAKNSKLKDFQDIVPTSLHAYADVFSETAFDSLPERRKWDHAIELECELSPRFRKVYPMTLMEQTEMDAFLEEALATGRIRQSKSPLGAPVFFIKKKDGKLRFIQDYRALNAITRKNQYPLLLIDDLIHRLKGTHYFTKLDMRWGYNNVRIREGNEWKAAFHCNVAHKPDLRTANYAPEFPPIYHLPSPFSSVTTTAAIFTIVITAATAVYVSSIVSAVLNITAVFTVSTAVVIVTAAISIASAVFTATTTISVSSASASDRLPHSVNSVRPWSYHPPAPFPQSVTSI